MSRLHWLDWLRGSVVLNLEPAAPLPVGSCSIGVMIVQFSLDTKSGVPFYRQIIEQAKFAVARGDLQSGDRLPTVRQLAVDLSINLNTVVRAYRELEFEGVIETQQGSGTFVTHRKPEIDDLERQRKLDQILTEFLARASDYGLTLDEVLEGLRRQKGGIT